MRGATARGSQIPYLWLTKKVTEPETVANVPIPMQTIIGFRILFQYKNHTMDGNSCLQIIIDLMRMMGIHSISSSHSGNRGNRAMANYTPTIIIIVVAII